MLFNLLFFSVLVVCPPSCPADNYYQKLWRMVSKLRVSSEICIFSVLIRYLRLVMAALLTQ